MNALRDGRIANRQRPRLFAATTRALLKRRGLRRSPPVVTAGLRPLRHSSDWAHAPS